MTHTLAHFVAAQPQVPAPPGAALGPLVPDFPVPKLARQHPSQAPKELRARHAQGPSRRGQHNKHCNIACRVVLASGTSDHTPPCRTLAYLGAVHSRGVGGGPFKPVVVPRGDSQQRRVLGQQRDCLREVAQQIRRNLQVLRGGSWCGCGWAHNRRATSLMYEASRNTGIGAHDIGRALGQGDNVKNDPHIGMVARCTAVL
jgi:hypothetical protein